MKNNNVEYGKKVTWVGIALNLFLTFFKFIIGYMGRSSALIADAVNSLSDVAATLLVQFGLSYSYKPKDDRHPYGHGKFESLVALFVGLLILSTAAFLSYENIMKLIRHDFLRPSLVTLGAAVTTIIIKEWMYRYTLRAGRALNSPSILANAMDHRSDVYASSGVFAGILGANLGWTFLDPVAALIIAGFILRLSQRVLTEAFHDLMDAQLPEDMKRKIESIIAKWPNAYGINEIKGRRMGMGYIVDLNLLVQPYLFSKDISEDFKKLQQTISNEVSHIGDINLVASVEGRKTAYSEDYLKERVLSILKRHEDKYIDVHYIDFHFLHDEQEIHFHLTLPADMNVEDSHRITEEIQHDIEAEFPHSQVIIHVEPPKN